MSDVDGRGELGPDERAELARLRGEVAALRTARSRRRFTGKAVGAAILVVLGALLAPVALVAVWAHNQVAETDRFVDSVRPLMREPAVRAVLTDRVTDAVFDHLDVRGLADQAVDALSAQGLPPRVTTALHGLTGPLESSVRSFTHTKVGEVFASERFAQTWDQVVTVAHTQAADALSGSSSSVSIEGGDVVIDLAPFIAIAKERLVDGGLTVAERVPELHPTITVADATTLVRARSAYSLLDAMATWLPVVAIVLLGAGVLLARDRRRTLLAAGLGVAAGMLLLAAALAVGRAVLVGEVRPDAAAAAAVSFDLVVRFLREGLRTLLVLGLVVALAAFLAGRSAAAVGIRRAATGSVAWLRGRGAKAGLRTGRAGTWVHTYRGVLRGAAVGVAVLVFVFLDRPGAGAVVTIALVLVVCLAVIQVFDQPPVAGTG